MLRCVGASLQSDRTKVIFESGFPNGRDRGSAPFPGIYSTKHV